MRIDVLTNDGSPIGVSEASIYGQDGRMGIGGAELAMLTLCRAWHDAGHKVVVYNDVEKGSVFEHRVLSRFSPFAPRDVLIIFRSPNTRIRDGANGIKVWWSCDQRTVGNFPAFAGQVDKIVTISPYHKQYFENMYGIFDTIPIDLPVRTWEYERDIEKVPYRCIFNSIPDRGALELAQVWNRIVHRVPEASLVLTSDWRLWSEHATEELLMQYRAAFANLDNVEYLGAVNRERLIEEEMKAQMHLNVNIYEELFCIAVAETQVAGAYPVSSTTGALETTCMGSKFPGNPREQQWQDEYVDYVCELLKDQRRLKRLANKTQHNALNRFSLERIMRIWDEKVFNG